MAKKRIGLRDGAEGAADERRSPRGTSQDTAYSAPSVR